jgi:flap endonuclease-1
MGIKGLLKFLKEYPDLVIKKNIEDYEGKKIAVDISIILYQVVIAIRNSGSDLVNKKGEITSHILGLFNKTFTLLKRNIIPIFVFDGKPPNIKSSLLNNRKKYRYKAEELMLNAKTEEERIKYFKRCVNISSTQIKQAKELLTLMGIPYINAPSEADTQCAYMCKNDLVYGVLTEDMDILTFGSNRIIRNLSSYKKDIFEIDLKNILDKLGFTRDNFIDFCILLGCDYCNGLSDIKANIIYKYFSCTKDIELTIKLLRKDNYEIEDFDYKEARNYFFDNNDVDKNISNNLDLKTPNIKKLEDLLVNKYGLIKSRIQNKINFLENNFTDSLKNNDVYTLNI